MTNQEMKPKYAIPFAVALGDGMDDDTLWKQPTEVSLDEAIIAMYYSCKYGQIDPRLHAGLLDYFMTKFGDQFPEDTPTEEKIRELEAQLKRAGEPK